MDPEYTTKYNSNVSTAIKLYAKWMPVSRYDVIVEGSYAQESGSGNYVEGEIVAIDAGSRSGYQFTGWTVSDGVTLADASKTGTTFTMPAKSVSVMANWKYNGSILLAEALPLEAARAAPAEVLPARRAEPQQKIRLRGM